MRSLFYLFSQYTWVIIIIIVLLIGVFMPTTKTIDPIKSSTTNIEWNDELNPEIIASFADTHINHEVSSRAQHFDMALNYSMKWEPSSVIITGDLVDNKPTELSYPKQSEEDYLNYHSVIDKYNISKILIDIAGNHDEYRIYNYESKHHYFLNYSSYLKTYNLAQKEFYVSKYETAQSEIISISPFRYPTINAKYGMWIYPPHEVLDNIEEFFIQNPQTKTRIIHCHYPLDLWDKYTCTSSTGKTLEQIITNNNCSMLITGHTHPSETTFIHTNGMLEVVASDLLKHKGFGIITIDNGRIVYHSLKIDDVLQNAFVTNPIPINQVSTLSIFNQKDIRIRVIVYDSNQTLNINYQINNENTTKKLKFNRYINTNNTISLYSDNINIKENGIYNLKFFGDYNYEMTFVIGDEIQLNKEKVLGWPNLTFTSRIGMFLIVFLLMLIVIPFRTFIPKFQYGQILNSWIVEDGEEESRKFGSIFLGFFAMNERISNLPTWLRIILFILLIYPIVLPTFFVEVDGIIGILWAYGFIMSGKNHFDVMGQIIVFIYYALVALPTFVFASSFSEFLAKSWSAIFTIDLIVFVCCDAAVAFMGYYLFNEMVDAWGCLTSPCFSIIPLVMIIIFTVVACRREKYLDKDMFVAFKTIL